MPPTWIIQNCRTKLRDYKMDPQCPIYPQRVPNKKSWADLTHLAHFAKSKPRDYRKWIRSVRFTPRGFEKKELGRFDAFRACGGCTEYNVAGRTCAHITLVAEDSGLRTQNSELRAQDAGLRTRNSELSTQDSELRTRDSELRT